MSYSSTIGRQLKLQLLVWDLDDTERRCGLDQIRAILILRLKTKEKQAHPLHFFFFYK